MRYGAALSSRGESGHGLRELRRANALLPDMPETLVELGKAEAASGDPAQAEVAWRKVVEIEPESGLAETAHFQLAQLYRRLKRAADADRELTLFRELKAKRAK